MMRASVGSSFSISRLDDAVVSACKADGVDRRASGPRGPSGILPVAAAHAAPAERGACRCRLRVQPNATASAAARARRCAAAGARERRGSRQRLVAVPDCLDSRGQPCANGECPRWPQVARDHGGSLSVARRSWVPHTALDVCGAACSLRSGAQRWHCRRKGSDGETDRSCLLQQSCALEGVVQRIPLASKLRRTSTVRNRRSKARVRARQSARACGVRWCARARVRAPRGRRAGPAPFASAGPSRAHSSTPPPPPPRRPSPAPSNGAARRRAPSTRAAVAPPTAQRTPAVGQCPSRRGRRCGGVAASGRSQMRRRWPSRWQRRRRRPG
jgi:hypothetical protein